jgi:hypothetical protein
MLRLLLVLSLAAPPARAQGPLAFPALLQRFVDQVYLKGFRTLGVEKDFDHAHLLFDAGGKPLGILYHTQELAPAGVPGGRNWLQRLDDGLVTDARTSERRSYPATAQWDYFRWSELPGLRAHRTILDKMLDPERLPVDASRTRQVVFSRVACGARAAGLRILLPTKERVCLRLSES